MELVNLATCRCKFIPVSDKHSSVVRVFGQFLMNIYISASLSTDDDRC